MQVIQEDRPFESSSEFKIKLEDPIVEYNIDYISYDIQSLIGEVGGTLGLTIGLSGFSIIELMIWLMQKMINNYVNILG
jgi:hypothetical protein